MRISSLMLGKQGALNNQMLRLGFCLSPLSKFLATCLSSLWGLSVCWLQKNLNV